MFVATWLLCISYMAGSGLTRYLVLVLFFLQRALEEVGFSKTLRLTLHVSMLTVCMVIL